MRAPVGAPTLRWIVPRADEPPPVLGSRKWGAGARSQGAHTPAEAGDHRDSSRAEAGFLVRSADFATCMAW